MATLTSNETNVLQAINLWQREGVQEVKSGRLVQLKHVPNYLIVATLRGVVDERQTETTLATLAERGLIRAGFRFHVESLGGWRLPDGRTVTTRIRSGPAGQAVSAFINGEIAYSHLLSPSKELRAGGPVQPCDCNAFALTEIGVEALAAKHEVTTDTTVGLISAAVASARYTVSRPTLVRSIRDGTLTDHRPKRSAKNAPYLLSEAEIAGRWPKR